MMRRSTKVLALCVAMMINVLVSCQATPSKENIVNKGDGQLMELIENSNQDTAVDQAADIEPKYQTPGQWKESFTAMGNLHVELDASVIVPDVSKYPVIQVQPDRFGVQKTQIYKRTTIWPSAALQSAFRRKIVQS